MRRYSINCSKCDCQLEENRVGKYSYCRKCHAEYMRVNRKPPKELSKSQQRKIAVRIETRRLLRNGVIKRQPCEKCGSEKSEIHHENYESPLAVKWLCRKCHLSEHGIKNIVLPPKEKKRKKYQIKKERKPRKIKTERIRNRKGRKPNCSKCGNLIEENRQGKYGYCKKCHATHMRNSRKISSPTPCS
jgi:hypothetical protein